MANVIALVITDLRESRLGLPSLCSYMLAGKTVLHRTVERLQQVKSVRKIVIVHPAEEDPLALIDRTRLSGDKPIESFAHDNASGDRFTPMRRAARKWAMAAWRGGLGTATCYDELLPSKPMFDAISAENADAALIVGGDWPLVDPGFCQQTAERHVDHPEAMQFTFTQAPPGLSGVTVGRELLEQMAENKSYSFGSILAYVPSHPQADPIGKDVCVQIPSEVRHCARRFIYDNSRSVRMIDELDVDYDTAGAMDITRASSDVSQPPQQVTIELNTKRQVVGPLAQPIIDGEPMALDAVREAIEKIAERSLGDTVITLGGNSDALEHPDWQEIVNFAKGQDILGICLETDLLTEPDDLPALLDVPIDVLSVRLNADTNDTYKKVMQPLIPDAFRRVTNNIQWLINERNRRWQAPDAPADVYPGVPWIVPRLIKTDDTLKDMETFFDRWMHYSGHAVIEPASGQATPPGVRVPPSHIASRATVTADGQLQDQS